MKKTAHQAYFKISFARLGCICLVLALTGVSPVFAQDPPPQLSVHILNPSAKLVLGHTAGASINANSLAAKSDPVVTNSGLVTGPIVTSGTISFTCDPNIDSAVPGTCAYLNGAFAGIYGATFTNANASIYIQYGATGLGQSVQYLNKRSYTAYRTALMSASSGNAVDVAAIASLPASEPVEFGADSIFFSTALGTALAFPPATLAGINLSLRPCFTVGTGGCYNAIITVATPAGQYYYRGVNGTPAQTATQYDFFTVVGHETNEVLGTTSGVSTNGMLSNVGGPSAVDLFRYSAPSTRVFISTNPGAYFSYDGGTTSVEVYNTLANWEDYADWVTNCKHVQDATGCPGQSFDITNDGGVEIAVLDAVGFNVQTDVTPTNNLLFILWFFYSTQGNT